VLLSNSHDGSLAVRVGFTPIRVVCANTLKLAHDNVSSQLIRVRHTKSMNNTLDGIREIMNLANMQFEATAEQYRRLASRACNSEDLEKYIKIVFKKESETPQFQTLKEKITANFEHGRGSELSRGTMWGAYNAITEYLGYEHGRNNDNRLNSLWFGTSDNLNQRAFDEAVKMAA